MSPNNLKSTLVLALVTLLTLLIFSQSLTAADFAASLQRPWLRLLQYRDDTSSSESVALNAEFFASATGMTDPVAEFNTLQNYFADPRILHPVRKEPWACVFPARFTFIKKAISADWKRPSCPEFDEWKQHFPREHVALVFSSAYKGNPASIFGHTFLVFNKAADLADQGRGTLFGYAVAFLADTKDDTNPVTYTVNGIFGGFQGKYDLNTYYETVNNYNNAENRDLWEYPLNLNDEERERLVEHLWEVAHSGQFKYYFFDENCSWHMLSLLEAARPQVDLKSLSPLVTIPSETIRDIKNQGLTTEEPRFRPSLRKRVDAHLGRLTSKEQADALKLLQGERPQPPPRPEAWDAAIMHAQWQMQRNNGNMTAEDKSRYRDVLSDRSKVPTSPQEIVINRDAHAAMNRPDVGHNLHHIELGGMTSRFAGETLVSPMIGFGLGFSDLLASDLGFEPDSGIRYLSAKLRLNRKTQAVLIQDATILAIEAFPAWRSYDPRWSWAVGAFAQNNHLWDVTDISGVAGAGVTYRSIVGDLRGLMTTKIAITNELNPSQHRLEIGPQITLSHSFPDWKAMITLARRHNYLPATAVKNETEWRAEAAWHATEQTEWRAAWYRQTTEFNSGHRSSLEAASLEAIEASLRCYF